MKMTIPNNRLEDVAPDMLEVLQLMVTWEDWIDDPDWLKLVKDARDVIAKATGKKGAE